MDVDDVLAQFRLGFFGWIKEKFGIEFDAEGSSYYNSTPVGDISNEEAFMEFIKSGGIRSLPINDKIAKSLKMLNTTKIMLILIQKFSQKQKKIQILQNFPLKLWIFSQYLLFLAI